MSPSSLDSGGETVVLRTSLKVTLIKLGGFVFALLSFVFIAHRFGVGPDTDALFVGRIIPLLIATQIGRAFSVAIVPILSKSLENERLEHSQRIITAFFTSLIPSLAVLALFYYLVAPMLLELVGAGLEAEARELSIEITQVLSVVVLLMGGFSILEAFMNAHRSFLVPEALATLYPLGTTFGVLVLADDFGIVGVPIGTVLGTTLMFCSALFVVLCRYGVGSLFSPRELTDLLKRALRQIVPVVWGGSAGQIANVVARSLAAGLGSGQASVLSYGYRASASVPFFWGLALGKVILPRLSAQAGCGGRDHLKVSLVNFLRLMLFLSVPYSLALIILRQPLISLLFGHGAFTAHDVAATANVVAYFAPAVAFSAVSMVAMRGFYSLERASIIYKTATFFLALCVILSVVLMRPMGVRGLALAYSVALLAQMTLILSLLQAHIGRFLDKAFAVYSVKVLLAAAIAGSIVHLGLMWGAPLDNKAATLLVLMAGVTLYMVIYILALYLFGIPEATALLRTVSKRIPAFRM